MTAEPPDRDTPGPDHPDGSGEQPVPRPRRGPLRPQGEDVAWSALGSLLAGPLVWGGVGILVDRWLGTQRTFAAIGIVVGSLTAFYIVYVRFGRDE